jgi:periplasmic copper chaperone A
MNLRRAGGALAVVVAVIGLWAGVAGAHVTVSPSNAEQGSFTVLTFRVPNERDDASTVRLSVKLPEDTPLAYVSVKPVPGWEIEVTEATLSTPIEVHGTEVTDAVSTVTWSGGTIAPGEFQEFSISVGPLPDVDSLTFPAVQTYSSGEEVAWIQVAEEGEPEADRPAPTMALVPSTGDGHGDGSSTDDTTVDDDHESASGAEGGDDHDDGDGNGLAIVALGVAGVAVVLSIVSLATRRSRPTS